MKEKELRVVEQEQKKLKFAELFGDSSSMTSEIIFPGLVLAHSSPEPSIIKFLLRMHGHLWVGALITLGDWNGRLQGGEGSGVLGGFSTTLCGRMPNPVPRWVGWVLDPRWKLSFTGG